MKLAGEYMFSASLGVVWDALFDAGVLARTLPGCDKLEQDGDQFSGVIRVKMGPVQGKFQGKVDISDVEDQQSYRMTIDGRGPAGFAKAKVTIALKSVGDETQMSYDGDIQIGGRIASVGQRLLDASVKAITKQSLENLHAQIKSLQQQANERASGATEASNSPSVALDAGQSKDVATGTESQASATELQGEQPNSAPTDKVGADRVVSSQASSDVEGPSQAAFALGIAREVTKELFPLKKVILIATVLVLAYALYRVFT